jgi:hypothetical protein
VPEYEAEDLMRRSLHRRVTDIVGFRVTTFICTRLATKISLTLSVSETICELTLASRAHEQLKLRLDVEFAGERGALPGREMPVHRRTTRDAPPLRKLSKSRDACSVVCAGPSALEAGFNPPRSSAVAFWRERDKDSSAVLAVGQRFNVSRRWHSGPDRHVG